jgi:hypothetical protein
LGTDEKNSINQTHDGALSTVTATVNCKSMYISRFDHAFMVKKNVFLISLQKAMRQYKLGFEPNTLSFLMKPLVSRKFTFLCKMQFFDFMQKIMKKYPKISKNT